MNPSIRPMERSDMDGILSTITAAFGAAKGPVICMLTWELIASDDAQPSLSIVAIEDKQVIGQVLFTNARLEGSEDDCPISILAPLAIRPEYQNKGVGGKLIKEGLKHLKKQGIRLVFVLGHPDYYSRHGFSPAGAQGFEAPYPIPEKNADAWMVQELAPDSLDSFSGNVICASALNEPEHWRE